MVKLTIRARKRLRTHKGGEGCTPTAKEVGFLAVLGIYRKSLHIAKLIPHELSARDDVKLVPNLVQN